MLELENTADLPKGRKYEGDVSTYRCKYNHTIVKMHAIFGRGSYFDEQS